MNKRSRILAGLTAGVMAVGAMCFGFARWSSDVTLNGSVSASGKWDVAITDASVELSDAGAALSTHEVTTAAEAYAVIAKWNSRAYSGAGAYNLVLDTVNGVQADVDLTNFSASGCAYYNQYNHDIFNGDPLSSGTYLYYYLDDSIVTEGTYLDKTYLLKKDSLVADGDVEGKVVGYAVKYKGAVTTEVTSETVINDTSVNYASVDFTLPEAWANYSVTITNNGTANANLSDYAFDVSELNEEIYTVDTPELGEEVLAPGESCTFNFVVKVDTDAQELAEEAADFTVTLNYVQDTVNEAPSAGHSHQ